MLQQNFRKPAALLASATSTAQNLIANDPEKGEKLITALEYGAINPSDLQPSSGSVTRKPSASFVPGGGIIFSSSPTPIAFKSSSPSTSSASANSRARRHSSFHPFSDTLIDPLDILVDESSQLSAEGMEFFSVHGHVGGYSTSTSDDEDDNVDVISEAFASATDAATSQAFNFLQIQQSADLGTEIFGSILAKVDDNLDLECHETVKVPEATPIRGHDVLLSDNP